MTVPSAFTDRKICIIGLGYVGLTLAVIMAEVGFDVTGIEVRGDVVDLLRRGKAQFFETGIDERLQRLVTAGRLRIEQKLPTDSAGSVYIITVGTPLGADGRARLDMIENATREVSASLRDDDLVILRSTVKLGSTRKVAKRILDESGKSYDLAFCPERTMEGRALEELRSLPQIVGGVTISANIRASQLFQFLTPTVVRVDTVETAEMIKLVDNSQRDVAFAFANEIARACEPLGISAMEVISAGKLGYPRTNLPIPGPVGGPCLSKDPYILAESLEAYGLKPEITLAARMINERQPIEAASRLKAYADEKGFPKSPVVALMGLAFKGRPETSDLRGTTARPILDALRDTFPTAHYRGFDAMVARDEIEGFGLESCADIKTALTGANVAVIANNHACFASMPLPELAAAMAKPAVIYDFWNTFDVGSLALPDGVDYMPLGGVVSQSSGKLNVA
jgi:nucleotide sugar dehydrogenase